MSNGLDDVIEEDDRRAFLKEDKNQSLEFENQSLKKQLALLQQQMEEKERTIRLLQQQMVAKNFVTFFFVTICLTSSGAVQSFPNFLIRLIGRTAGVCGS